MTDGLQWLPNVDLGTSRRAARTGPCSCGREPAFAVSPHAGNSPWRKKGGEGRKTAIGTLLVPVDPLGHEPLVAETFIRDSAALDAGETLGKGHLLG